MALALIANVPEDMSFDKLRALQAQERDEKRNRPSDNPRLRHVGVGGTVPGKFKKRERSSR